MLVAGYWLLVVVELLGSKNVVLRNYASSALWSLAYNSQKVELTNSCLLCWCGLLMWFENEKCPAITLTRLCRPTALHSHGFQ